MEAGLDADDARRAPVRLGAAGVGGLRLIHLSDLHATDHRHVWDYDGGLRRRRSESAAKLDRLVTLLRLRRPELAGASVVITGDLTDRGDRTGHRLAAAFVDAVRSEGYGVHVVPGNHDWFWKGNRGADAVLERARALTAARPGARRRAPLARVARLHALTRHRYPAAVDVAGGRLLLLDSLLGHLDDRGRGQRSRDRFAQGRLGAAQLDWLDAQLDAYQALRQAGHRMVVSLHHPPVHTAAQPRPGSPVRRDRLGGLWEAEDLLDVVAGRVDALLCGHSTPVGVHHQDSADAVAAGYGEVAAAVGVPLLHCVNLEHARPSGPRRYVPVTVIDFDRAELQRYDACRPAADPTVHPVPALAVAPPRHVTGAARPAPPTPVTIGTATDATAEVCRYGLAG